MNVQMNAPTSTQMGVLCVYCDEPIVRPVVNADGIIENDAELECGNSPDGEHHDEPFMAPPAWAVPLPGYTPAQWAATRDPMD